MKRVFIKSIILVLLVLLIYILMPNTTFALDEIFESGKNFINAGGEEAGKINTGPMKDTSNYIYNILFTIAVVIAVAIGMIIGIQFMMGNSDEQAKIKETLIPYVVGVFVVFASFTIWKIAVNMGEDISPTPIEEVDGPHQESPPRDEELN